MPKPFSVFYSAEGIVYEITENYILTNPVTAFGRILIIMFFFHIILALLPFMNCKTADGIKGVWWNESIKHLGRGASVITPDLM